MEVKQLEHELCHYGMLALWLFPLCLNVGSCLIMKVTFFFFNHTEEGISTVSDTTGDTDIVIQNAQVQVPRLHLLLVCILGHSR